MKYRVIDKMINDHNDRTGDLLHVIKHLQGYSLVLGSVTIISCDTENELYYAVAALRNYAKRK